MNKFTLYIIIVCLLIIGAGFYITHKPINTNNNLQVEGFSKKYIKAIQQDSFSNLLKTVYKNNIKITDNKKQFFCTIFNQGQFLNNFFNTNTALLKEQSYGFKLQLFATDSLQASFEKIQIDSVNYINIPTDVLVGVINQLSNK